MPWSGVQLMFLERVNLTLMGMVIDWVIDPPSIAILLYDALNLLLDIGDSGDPC